MKPCRTCGNEYEPTAREQSIYDYQCKPCRREHWRQYRAKRKAAGNPVVSGSDMPRDYHRKYESAYFENDTNKEKRNAHSARYRKEPHLVHKYQARLETRKAIKKGILIKMPCEVCGGPKVDAHHDDYSKPLEIRWMCRVHHLQYHSSERKKAQESV